MTGGQSHPHLFHGCRSFLFQSSHMPARVLPTWPSPFAHLAIFLAPKTEFLRTALSHWITLSQYFWSRGAFHGPVVLDRRTQMPGITDTKDRLRQWVSSFFSWQWGSMMLTFVVGIGSNLRDTILVGRIEDPTFKAWNPGPTATSLSPDQGGWNAHCLQCFG